MHLPAIKVSSINLILRAHLRSREFFLPSTMFVTMAVVTSVSEPEHCAEEESMQPGRRHVMQVESTIILQEPGRGETNQVCGAMESRAMTKVLHRRTSKGRFAAVFPEALRYLIQQRYDHMIGHN